MKNQEREGKKGNKWQLLKGSRSLKKANGAKKWKKQIRQQEHKMVNELFSFIFTFWNNVQIIKVL